MAGHFPMTETQILKSFRLTIERNPRNIHVARQNVYQALHNLYGRHWLSLNSERIKGRLKEIEQEVAKGVNP